MKSEKKPFSRIKKVVTNTVNKAKKLMTGPAEFLAGGQMGGILSCIILTALFVKGCFLQSLMQYSPSYIVLCVAGLLTIIVAEILWCILRIIFGRISQARAYFLTAWLLMLLTNCVANQMNAVFLAFVMSLCVVAATDVLGRCIWAWITARRYRYIFGYVAGAISIAILVLFGYFFNTDNFGDSRIEFYTANEDAGQCGANGFDNNLRNGELEVLTLTYGNSEACDIVTDSIDLSRLENRSGIMDSISDMVSDMDFHNTPVAGKIWYPKGESNCPTMFIVHGAHDSATPSYLGYDYLGEYLASYGYVVVSVDENIINELGAGNDVRAILLLENMKTILEYNASAESKLYGMIDDNRIAIAGHSRGGEMVATAYLFNGLEVYPDNGNIKLDYHFNISAIVAIAPTVDQYMPASHAVEIEDVDYLLLHGSNDQDVSIMMGEKQYNNVTFSGNEEHYKASVYILGANHGQFNTMWGQYDLTSGMNGYLNTNNFLKSEEQQLIAKAYFKVFLDKSLKGDDRYATLLEDNSIYRSYLPQTAYITNYSDSTYSNICSFADSVDLLSADAEGAGIRCYGMTGWRSRPETYGSRNDGDNYVLSCIWKKDSTPSVEISIPSYDMTDGFIAFRMADVQEGCADNSEKVSYTVELMDASGNRVSVENPQRVYPCLAVQLYKQDVLSGSYEYKYQMQSVVIRREMFGEDNDFDYGNVRKIVIYLDGTQDGRVIIDDICSGIVEPKNDI